MVQKIEEEDWRSNVAGVVATLGGLAVGVEWYYALTFGVVIVGAVELALKGIPALGYDSGAALVSNNWVSFASGGAATTAGVALLGMEVWVALCVGVVVSILFESVADDVPVEIESNGRSDLTPDEADHDNIKNARDAYINGEISREAFEQEVESTFTGETDTTVEKKDTTRRSQLNETEP